MKKQKTDTKQIKGCKEKEIENNEGQHEVQPGDKRISIRGYEGFYEVDTRGRIRSCRARRRNEGQVTENKRRLVKPRKKWSKVGAKIRMCVTLYHPLKKKHHFAVAKVVYGCFNGTPLNFRDDQGIIHVMDGDQMNMRLDNLRKMTFAEGKQLSMYEKRRGL